MSDLFTSDKFSLVINSLMELHMTSQTRSRIPDCTPPADPGSAVVAHAESSSGAGTDYFVPAGGVVLGTCIQVGVAYPFGCSGGGYFLSDEFGWSWWPTLGEMTSALASRISEQRV